LHPLPFSAEDTLLLCVCVGGGTASCRAQWCH
jgi:hypothetical protein